MNYHIIHIIYETSLNDMVKISSAENYARGNLSPIR